MSGPFRVGPGEAVDASRTVQFTFDGRTISAHPGDTVASALLAHGIHLMGRSFKYHRPRGVLGAGSEEPNALVGVDRGPGRFEPNHRATMVQVAEGLVVESQNRRPSLQWDWGAVNDLLAPLIPVGFYYKTFMWPRSFWAKIYEPKIRGAAGLGRPPTEPDPDRYAQRWAHVDVLVVGGGPAGLSAALAAGGRGERVILCEEGEAWGGSLSVEAGAMVEGLSTSEWVGRTVEALSAMANVRLLHRTTGFGYGIGNLVALAQRGDDFGTVTRERLWLVRAGKVVIATGAIERPVVFPNNDRPGIMLASAARTYLARYGVLVGRRVAVVANHDSGYRTAFDLAAAGALVTVRDSRAEVASDLATRASELGVELRPGHIPLGSKGRLRVKALAIGREPKARPRWIECDAVAMAGGWTPSVHLFSQSGGKVVWDEALEAFVPGLPVQPQASVGACAGSFGLGQSLAEGWAAGNGQGDGPVALGDRSDRGAFDMAPEPHREGARRKAFVDFQNDVTAKDVRLAVREGFRSVEHLKRYTTTGMATDQGRTSNINAMAIAAQALGQSIPETGLTTFRAPFSPVTFGTMTGFARGPLFDPVRTTPLHARAVEGGAVFEDVGQWKRARYFPRPGEDMEEAVRRECLAVRSGVGLFDASTLGKIEVVGPDAAVFLDFILTGRPSTLAQGRCRYGLMLREDGFIYDDGVTARLALDRFHVTTTSGGAANVLALMEDFRQTELPHLKVWLTSTTEQWAVIAVNGPKARELLRPLVQGVSLDTETFPHMSVREARIGSVPVRLFRVSFTGEHGYEINVPPSRALEVWDTLATAGEAHAANFYGTETAHVLRAEKGYIIVGHETDGTVVPADVGLGKMVAMKKQDFVGKRSLMRAAMLVPERKQLVALLPTDGQRRLEEGAQVIDPAQPGRAIGHVTSAYGSATLGRPFALALVRAGRARVGTRLAIADVSDTIPVQVNDPVLFDPEGARLDA